VLELLLRFYRPARGRILLGGEDLASLPEAVLRSSVAAVFQAPTLPLSYPPLPSPSPCPSPYPYPSPPLVAEPGPEPGPGPGPEPDPEHEPEPNPDQVVLVAVASLRGPRR